MRTFDIVKKPLSDCHESAITMRFPACSGERRTALPQHRAALNTIELVYFNAGNGHRSAAGALDAVIREQARRWRVRLINLFDVFDPRSLFRKTTG